MKAATVTGKDSKLSLTVMILIGIVVNHFYCVEAYPSEHLNQKMVDGQVKKLQHKRFANLPSPDIVDKCIMACATCSTEDFDEVK